MDPELDPESTREQREVTGLQSELQELRNAIEKERNDREDALVAQEHRLIPAVRQLASTFSDPTKRSQRVSAISALAWCLVPSGAAAAGGGALIIALLTAALTLQQVRMMSAQNQQMSIQNALSEAQRRSNQLSELGPLLTAIEIERGKVEQLSADKSSCNDKLTTRCLRALDPIDFPPEYKAILNGAGKLSEIERYGKLYVPSEGIANQIAQLTSSLRVYRSLAEDPADIECLPEEKAPPNQLSNLARLLPFELSPKQGVTAKDVARRVYPDSPPSARGET